MSPRTKWLGGKELTQTDITEVKTRLAAMSAPLNAKIDLAINLLKFWEFAAKCDWEHGYWLAFSGGKDSQVIYELAKMADIKFKAMYNNTTIDPPELIYFMKENYPDVEWNNPDMPLLRRLVVYPKGPPTRKQRWCCSLYKEHGGTDKVKIIGVRAAESPRRKHAWTQVTKNRNIGTIICPIVFWKDEDIWEFHRLHNLKHCKLYDEGFKRLGCIGCPLAGPIGQQRDFKRWPRYELAWKKAVKAYYDKWLNIPTREGKARYITHFNSFEHFWYWWLSGDSKNSKDDEDCQGISIYS